MRPSKAAYPSKAPLKYYNLGYTNVCRDKLITQICLQIWSGGMPLLLSPPLSDVTLSHLGYSLSDIITYLSTNIGVHPLLRDSLTRKYWKTRKASQGHTLAHYKNS